MKKLASLVVFCLGIYATAAWGQATTSLRGTVTDSSGSAIHDAQVTVLNAATNFTRSAATSGEGNYVFVELLPGTYTLTVEAKGFKKYVQVGVPLRVELPATVNVRMQVGASSTRAASPQTKSKVFKTLILAAEKPIDKKRERSNHEQFNGRYG